jgi:hypothetical protein
MRAFEHMVLRRIFGLKGKNNRRLEKLHNEDLRNLYFSRNIIRMTKSRRMRYITHGRKEKCIEDFRGQARRK